MAEIPAEERRAKSGEELVEWVDDDGRVLDIVSRQRVRTENLMHRSVAVVLRSPPGYRDGHGDVVPNGSVLVHERAGWKDLWPGYWDLAVGGVVGVGEPSAAAARRELAEEVGIEAPEVLEIGGFRYRDANVAAIYRVFSVLSAGPFHYGDGEVVATGWVPVRELRNWAADRVVCPDSLHGVLPLLH